MKDKTVVIFGVFDGVHDGHRDFIKQAKKEGDRLVAIVARDEIVLKLKDKLPSRNEVERINDLLNVPEIDLVLLGDPEYKKYSTLKEINPDIIFLGYDQDNLLNDIKEKIKEKYLTEFELKQGKPYKEDVYKSSILNNY